jgi:hypothetical protein
MASIEYVKGEYITGQSWDRCIKYSFNGSLEAFSWYLNLFCDRWDALIEGDYKTVMPLPVVKRMGFPMVITPLFINQLGIYSSEPHSAEKTGAFLALLKRKFRYINLCLNKYTPDVQKVLPVKREKYYELDLIRPYVKIIKGYSPENQSKLHLAVAKQYNVVRGIAPNEIISMLKREKIKLAENIGNDDFKLLRMMLSAVIRYKAGELYGVYNEVNMLDGAVLFTWYTNQISVLFAFATKKAILENAHRLMLDKFIEKNAETNTTLGFHCINSAHTPDFYRSFGATTSYFQRVQMNSLPFYIKPFFH